MSCRKRPVSVVPHARRWWLILIQTTAILSAAVVIVMWAKTQMCMYTAKCRFCIQLLGYELLFQTSARLLKNFLHDWLYKEWHTWGHVSLWIITRTSLLQGGKHCKSTTFKHGIGCPNIISYGPAMYLGRGTPCHSLKMGFHTCTTYGCQFNLGTAPCIMGLLTLTP